MTLEFNKAKHVYTLDGVVLPSVTRILDTLNKAGLPWWGQVVAAEGFSHLWHMGVEIPFDDPEGMVKLLTEFKLTVNHVKSKAADRGTGIHEAAESYAHTGELPPLSNFPEEERGYVRAMAMALTEIRPEILETEVAVYSEFFKFAGTFDAIWKIKGTNYIVDYKTSKSIYDSALIQVAAYQLAHGEMGTEPITRAQAVLRLAPDGTYEFQESVAQGPDFLAVLSAYNALERIKTAKREAKKRAKAKARG